MLYREIIAVRSQIHTKHTNTLCGQNVELLNVELVVPLEFKDYQFLKNGFFLSLCLRNPLSRSHSEMAPFCLQ